MSHCLNEATLQAYLDDEAPVDLIGDVIAHLAVCDRCAARARDAEREHATIALALDDESQAAIPTARLRERIESALAEKRTERLIEAPARGRAFDNIFWGRALVAATALLFAGFIGWVALRSTAPLDGRRTEGTAQDNAPKTTIENPPGERQTQQPSEIVNHKGFRKGRRLLAVKKSAPDFAAPSFPETEMFAKASAPEFAASIFDLETTRHLEKAQVLLLSFRNASSSSARDLAYDKRVSRELLLHNILLRREAEVSENAPAKSILNNLEPLLLDIANLPARPAAGELSSVKKRIRKSEMIVALHVFSTPTAAFE